MNESFTGALARRVLLVDGAMGTLAQASGVRADGPGVELCVVAPELVTALHRRYLTAGADVLQTHTYGASRLRLERHGLARRVREINLAGARLATSVRDTADRPVWVAGSVSPATPPRRGGPLDVRTAAAAIREQVEALVEGGVDLVLLETFARGTDLLAAVDVVREVTDLPVVAQATFVDEDGAPLTVAGEAPGEVLALLLDRGLAAVGTNCTLGPQGLLDILRRMGTAHGTPLAAQPNSGLPHMVADRSVRYAADAEHFARYVRHYVAAGARLVGGCCGTTPEHTAAAAAALTAHDAWTPGTPVGTRGVVLTRLAVESPDPGGDATVESVAESPAPTAAGPGRGRLEQWLWSRPGRRPFLVAAEIAGQRSPAEQVARAQATAAGGAGMLWVGRTHSRRAATSPAGLAVHLHERVEVDTAVTVTSWHTSVVALQADLLGLHALGLRAVVCETGNPPVHAEQPVRDGLWEVDAMGLLRLAVGLNRGVDVDGGELATATAFRLGARFTPGADDLEREADRMLAKVEAGAEFLVSRPVFEVERLRRLTDALAAAGRRVPVLASAGPLLGYAHAERLRHEVPDVVVPDHVLERMRRAGEGHVAVRAGLELTEDLVRDATGIVDGVVVRWTGPGVPGLDPATAVARLRTAAAGG